MLLYETKNAWYGVHANKEDNTIIAIMKYDKVMKKAVCHTYKVKPDNRFEYTYKIQRTQIKAIEGAAIHAVLLN